MKKKINNNNNNKKKTIKGYKNAFSKRFFKLPAPNQHFRRILMGFEASRVFPTWFALPVYQNMT